jgi:GMP synthase-like glutamine amidotransferase
VSAVNGSPRGADPGRIRVGLLECDHTDPELRGIDGDYGEMFVRLFAQHAAHLALTRIDLIGGAPLPPLDAFDAYVVTGSRLDAVAQEPWILALGDFLRRAHEAATPAVGICFGHQLIAHALGGRVERAEEGWGVGVHAAEITAAIRPPDVPHRFRLLLSHQDQVLALPEGAELLATSGHAPIAAFQVGSLLGFQGHPEFSPRFAAALMDRRADRIGAEVIADARRTLDTPTDQAAITGWIGDHLTGRST